MGIWEQLGLDMARHRMVALVGRGQDLTLYALARQAADSGRTVVVTTTTHILRHPGLPLVEEPTPERLRAALEGHGVVTVGTVFRGDKLSGAGTPEELRRAADVVLVEADGAKRLPLKAPAEYEPVIPPCADAVAAVAGMDAVGQAVGAVCHRPERVCALLGAGAEHVLTPEDVALLLANPQGGRKGVGEAMALRLSRDFSAFSYWTVPRIALSTSTAKMTMVLSTLPEKAEITAAIMSMSTMRSLNCSRKTWSVLFFFPSESLLGPYCSARRRASWADSPSAEAFCASRACCGVFL